MKRLTFMLLIIALTSLVASSKVDLVTIKFEDVAVFLSGLIKNGFRFSQELPVIINASKTP